MSQVALRKQNAVVAWLGFRKPSMLREQLILSAVLLLFASVFAARLFFEDVEQAVALLYALPIALVAVEYGARAGLMSAGVAFCLFGLYTRMYNFEVNALGWSTRALVFFLLGGLVGLLSDRLRDLDREVRENEARLKGILDNTTSVVALKDLEGHFLLVNRRYEQVFKVSEEEIVGKTDVDIFPKVTADAFRATDRKALKAREPVEIEEVIRHRDGPHTYITIKFPLFDALGEPYAVCGISTDITERITAEQLIRESKKHLRRVIDTAHEAYVSIDSNSVITDWNQQAEATFGWTRAQVIGRSLVDLVIPERYRARHLEGLKGFLENGKGSVLKKRMELTALHRDGREFPIEMAVSALRTKRGFVFNAFLHDISERKRTEELSRVKTGLERQTAELKRSNRELAQFAHVASHDLSEPLRTVTRYVQLLDNRYRGRLDDDADEFIGYAVEGATRMQALVNALNTYSTLGSAEYSPVKTDSAIIVRSVLDSLRASIDKSSASIEVVEPLPVLTCDPVQLAEVFQNLVSNAIKFVEEGRTPKIRISAERKDDGWCFAVADNGIGIKPEHQSRIFEMFRRLHKKGTYEGTGIGLTISQKVIARHGGQIWVDEAPGGGSVFRFTIPDRQEAPTPAGNGQNGGEAVAPVGRGLT
jgi:PAS domain S-box-containing protein